jgi:ATP-dependent RNA circularization protein (DNA/RNA ligase family)
MKYPKTLHLPWSESLTSDADIFSGYRVVVTEKMDGENTGMTCSKIHARSLESNDHPSRHWVKRLWSTIKEDIPESMKIFGENVYAKHSIKYTKLETYFYVISIWIYEECLSWNETKQWCDIFNLQHVPVIYEGKYEEKTIKSLYSPLKPNNDEMEGYVIRKSDSFYLKDFKSNIAKFVRANHIRSSNHWLNQKMVKNDLAEEIKCLNS